MTRRATPTPTTDLDDSELAEAKMRLEEVGGLIEATNEDREGLYAERLDLWKKLRAAGVDREEMARLAGTSVQMIKFAFSNDRKKGSSADRG